MMLRMLRRRIRWGSDRGSPSVEFAGLLPLLLVAALFAWQLSLVAFVATQAENAARVASRAQTLSGDGVRAGEAALSPYLRADAQVRVVGQRSTVRIPLPIILPSLNLPDLAISRSAELPDTG